jgi:hypothetical protein
LTIPAASCEEFCYVVSQEEIEKRNE